MHLLNWRARLSASGFSLHAQDDSLSFIGGFISKTALEELYTAAENSGADVVYNGAYYSYNEDKNIELKRDKEGTNLLKKGLQDKPTLTIDDAEKKSSAVAYRGKSSHALG